jgi:hypothetical protein
MKLNLRRETPTFSLPKRRLVNKALKNGLEDLDFRPVSQRLGLQRERVDPFLNSLRPLKKRTNRTGPTRVTGGASGSLLPLNPIAPRVEPCSVAAPTTCSPPCSCPQDRHHRPPNCEHERCGRIRQQEEKQGGLPMGLGEHAANQPPAQQAWRRAN